MARLKEYLLIQKVLHEAGKSRLYATNEFIFNKSFFYETLDTTDCDIRL